MKYDPILKFEVYGNLPSMKNSRKLVRNKKTNKIFSIKSDAARNYCDFFLKSISNIHKINTSEPVALFLHVFYKSKRNDLDGELICDLLEKANIINNDRQIVEKHFYKHIDRGNPRIKIILTLINENNEKKI